jgi:signal transduction histidine kinase
MSVGSLRLRLLLGASAFILVAVVASAFGLTVLFKNQVERWIDAELRTDLDQLIAGIDAPAGTAITIARPPPDPRFERPLSGLYWQVAVETHGPLLRSRSLWDYQIPQPAEAGVDDVVHHHIVPGPSGQRLYLLQRRVELPARLGARTARAAIALDDAEVRAAVWRFAAALTPLLLLLGALLTAAAWVQVAYGLRPLAAMRAKLSDIGVGVRARLGTGFPDEVQPLAREIDALLDARDAQVARARAQAADLAHGLKTPLQVLAGDAERLRSQGADELGDKIEELTAAMHRHVERHLARARMGAGGGDATADVREVVERVVRVVERAPEGQRLAWAVAVAPGLRARIDAQDLTEALGNLVENAARHAEASVTIAAARDGDTAVISVADDGPGIPEARRAEALRRGGRLDQTAPGAGLGLSIVADIADAWGATLDFDSPERGLRVTLRIPSR